MPRKIEAGKRFAGYGMDADKCKPLLSTNNPLFRFPQTGSFILEPVITLNVNQK